VPELSSAAFRLTLTTDSKGSKDCGNSDSISHSIIAHSVLEIFVHINCTFSKASDTFLKPAPEIGTINSMPDSGTSFFVLIASDTKKLVPIYGIKINNAALFIQL